MILVRAKRPNDSKRHQIEFSLSSDCRLFETTVATKMAKSFRQVDYLRLPSCSITPRVSAFPFEVSLPLALHRDHE